MGAATRRRSLRGIPAEVLSLDGNSVIFHGEQHDVDGPWSAVAFFEACAERIDGAIGAPFEKPVDASGLLALGRATGGNSDPFVVALCSNDPVAFFNVLNHIEPVLPERAGDVPPGFFCRHVFRYLAAESRTLDLRLETGERFTAAVLRDAEAFGLEASVTELTIGDSWDSESQSVRLQPIDLASRLPNLRELVIPWWLWQHIGGETFRVLETLALDHDIGPPQPPQPAQLIAQIARKCPALRELRVHCPLSPDVLVALTKHRLPGRLELLELDGALGSKPREFHETLLRTRTLIDGIKRLRLRPPHRPSLRSALAESAAVEFIE